MDISRLTTITLISMNKTPNNKIILVTGANGFVGRHLLAALQADPHYTVRAIIRAQISPVHNLKCSIMPIQDLSATINWQHAVENCHTVIHTAAKVHCPGDNNLGQYRNINVAATIRLARQAAEYGVQRFIFISSIKVNGEQSALGQPYTIADLPHPGDAYAISKYEAEQALLELSTKTTMQIIIIRPPLIYGAGVKGNFQLMCEWLAKGYPLPLKKITNKRSLVSIYNLIDLILHCIEHPQAGNRIFFVSDNEDLSTTELLHKVGIASNKPVRLFYLPYYILSAGAFIMRKMDVLQRLCTSLQVDISDTCNLLHWQPPLSVTAGLTRMFHDN